VLQDWVGRSWSSEVTQHKSTIFFFTLQVPVPAVKCIGIIEWVHIPWSVGIVKCEDNSAYIWFAFPAGVAQARSAGKTRRLAWVVSSFFQNSLRINLPTRRLKLEIRLQSRAFTDWATLDPLIYSRDDKISGNENQSKSWAAKTQLSDILNQSNSQDRWLDISSSRGYFSALLWPWQSLAHVNGEDKYKQCSHTNYRANLNCTHIVEVLKILSTWQDRCIFYA